MKFHHVLFLDQCTKLWHSMSVYGIKNPIAKKRGSCITKLMMMDITKKPKKIQFENC